MFLFSFCAVDFHTLKKMQLSLEFNNSFIFFLSAPKTGSCRFGLSKDIFQSYTPKIFFFSSLNIHH